MRVRIAVAVDFSAREWASAGWTSLSDKDAKDDAVDMLTSADRIVWIEADIPEPEVIEGEVVE